MVTKPKYFDPDGYDFLFVFLLSQQYLIKDAP